MLRLGHGTDNALTHDLIASAVACKRRTQNWAYQQPFIELTEAYQILPFPDDLLATEGFW